MDCMTQECGNLITETGSGWGWQEPPEIIQPNLPAHLEQVPQDCIQVGLESLQKGRLHSLSMKLVPVLCHPHTYTSS